MCSQNYTPVIGCSETNWPDTHLYKCGLQLNKFGAIPFAKNISTYLLELLFVVDNSRNGILQSQQSSCKIEKNFVSQSVYNSIDVELPGLEELNLSANLNKTST